MSPGHAAATVAALVLLVPPAVLLPAVARIPGPVLTGVAGLLCAGATVIVTMIAVSFVHALNVPGILSFELVVAVASAGLWVARARPSIVLFLPPGELVSGIRRHRAVALLVGGALGALAFQLVMGLAVAPNEYDSLLYHLPRAAYWVQQHSALQLQPGAPADPRVAAAPNAELAVAWTMVLSAGDHLAAMVQFLCVVGLGGAVYAGARLLGFGRPPAVFAGALFVTMPETILQAVTPQNDAVVSFTIVTTVLFGVIGLRDRSLGCVTIAAVAAGLGLGTKGSIFFAAPPIALVWVAAGWRWRPTMGWLIRAAAAMVTAVVMLGSFNYVQNEVNLGSVTGGTNSAVKGDFSAERSSGGLPITAARLAWVFVDASGVPSLDLVNDPLSSPRDALFSGVKGGGPDPLKTEVSDDESGYGLTGFLLLLPVVLLTALGRRVAPALRLLATASLGYFLLFALYLGYSREAARLLMPFVALGAPLLAVLAERRVLRWIAVTLAVTSVVSCLVRNLNRPILVAGEPSIFQLDRVAQQLIDSDLSDKQGVLRRLNRYVPADGRVGFVIQMTPRLRALDYPLFGPRLARHVVALDATRVTRSEIVRERLDGIVVWDRTLPLNCARASCPIPPPGLRAVPLGGHTLLITGPAR